MPANSEDFMRTPLEELVEQIVAGKLHIHIGKVFHLDEIVEAHRCMEENKAGRKTAVLTLAPHLMDLDFLLICKKIKAPTEVRGCWLAVKADR